MAELVVGDEFAGYRVEGLAGRGGMGVVYRMRHLRLDRIDAVKVIAPQHASDAEFRARFERESRIAAGLEHPHVVQIYHAGEEDGRLYLAMRYVHGTDLRAELKRYGRLDVWRAVEIVSQVASALDVAHEIGLVHRDVKPANVLLSRRHGRDHAFLSDFGLTKDLSSRGRETRTGMLVGTTGYIAPEQVTGAPLTCQADIYSLGCVLYHLLSGSVPYPRELELAAAVAHVNEPLPSLVNSGDELARRFDPVIRIAMAKNPTDRFASAGELAKAARAAAGVAPVGAADPLRTWPATGTAGRPADQTDPLTVFVMPAVRDATPATPAGEHDRTIPLTGAEVGTDAVARDGVGQPDGRSRSRARSRTLPILLALVGAGIVATAVVLILSNRSSPSPPPPPSSDWRTLPGLPIPIADAGVAAYSGAVWVVGGQSLGSSAHPGDTVWVYRPAVRQWRAGPPLPVALDDPAVVSDGRYLYAIGGYTGQAATAQTWILNKPSGQWRRYIPLPQPRSAGAAAWDGSRIVFGGGAGVGGAQDSVWALQGGRWIPIGSLARAREHLAAAANTSTGSVWLIGGTDAKGDVAYPDVDIAYGNAVRKGPGVLPVQGAAAVAVGSGYCVLGGYRHGTVLGQALCEGTGGGLPPFSPGRSKLGAAILHGTIYTVGGHTGYGVNGTRTVQAIAAGNG